MVCQKGVKFPTKGKIKKNISKTKVRQDDQQQMGLAGPREAMAMEVLHTMFMKSLANKANLLTFEAKKTQIDKKTMVAGAVMALENASAGQSDSGIDSDVSD